MFLLLLLLLLLLVLFMLLLLLLLLLLLASSSCTGVAPGFPCVFLFHVTARGADEGEAGVRVVRHRPEWADRHVGAEGASREHGGAALRKTSSGEGGFEIAGKITVALVAVATCTELIPYCFWFRLITKCCATAVDFRWMGTPEAVHRRSTINKYLVCIYQ